MCVLLGFIYLFIYLYNYIRYKYVFIIIIIIIFVYGISVIYREHIVQQDDKQYYYYSPCHNTWTIVRWACSVYRGNKLGGNKLACNSRPHAITQRVLAQQKIIQQLWHGL